MEPNGYLFRVKNVESLAGTKAQYNAPLNLQSRLTAIVDGYTVEGHVPFDEVERLLAEQPDIVELAVSGDGRRRSGPRAL